MTNKRKIIFDKTNGKCGYCGISLDYYSFDIDHIKPRYLGGKKNVENLIASCKQCNCSKGKKDIEQFRIHCGRKKEKIPYFSTPQILWLQTQGFIFKDKFKLPKFYFETITSEK